MADNVDITPGTGATIALDDVGGVLHQRVKLSLGADGAATDALGGAGAVANGVQRVTLASDDPAVTILTAVQKAEDAAHSSGDKGIMLLAVREATATDLSAGNTDGDYEPLQVDANGALWTRPNVTYGSGTTGTSTQRVTLATDVALPTGTNSIGAVTNTHLTNFGSGNYETVAASQTAQALGATGATGDYISGLLVIPATTSPGQVLLLDNATSITVFVGGSSSVSNLVPFFIPLGMISVSGAWKVTTGSNVSVIGIGKFT